MSHIAELAAVRHGSPQLSRSLVLGSKLVPPHPPRRLVARPRLLDLLTAAVQRRLTLVAAPAGSGKTVLLTSWLAAGDVGVTPAWVSLDAGDDHPARFWSHVLTALRRSGALPPGSLLGELAAPASPGGPFLVLLANGLAELHSPVVLVLDDFHEIGHPEVIAGVEFLVRHGWPQLRLVIASRSDPLLPLARLRVMEEVAEIRTAELAFTVPEAAELLAGHGVVLDPSQLVSLHARTEGWAVGLRLAALTLDGHPRPERLIAEFAGDDRTVADYLVGEVLARQTPQARDFLLRTSVPERLCGGLADALTGRDDGARMLEELRRMNAFVVPCGQRRSWYRYHQLFRELLRAELRRDAPEELRGLHLRAARWHAANGLVMDAVGHALAAQDWELAAGLLGEHWFGALVHGDVATLRRMLAGLPSGVLRGKPELGVATAVARLLDTEELDDADRYCRTVERRLRRLSSDRQRRGETALAVGRLFQARLRGDRRRAVAAMRRLQEAGAHGPAPGEGEDQAVLATALAALGTVELWTGDADGAVGTLRRGLRVARRTGHERAELACLSQLALLEAGLGRLGGAWRVGRHAVELAERHGWSRTLDAIGGHLALAQVCHERADLDGAEDYLGRARQAAHTVPDRLAAVGIALVRAQVRLASGDPGGGCAALAGAREGGSALPAFLERALKTAEARARVALGDAAGARALLKAAAGGRPPQAEQAVVLARLELDLGEPVLAAKAVAGCLDGSSPAFHLGSLLEAWLLDAIAAQALGDDDRAFRSMERALALADAEGFRQAFLRDRAAVHGLLGRQLDWGTAHVSLVTELIDRLDRHEASGGTPPALIEPLTERERVVLRYLPSVLSNIEIAAELYVSVNTVKTHVRSIYRKLDAGGRRDAVKRARLLHLL